MVKVRISIAMGECNTYYDYSAEYNGKHNKSFIGEYIETELPALPRVGDYMYLGENHSKKLAQIISANKRTAEYNEGWYDYNDLDEEGEPKLKKVRVTENEICEENQVIQIQFQSEWDFVWIILG